MDTITLTGVHANGTHGVLAFEHERPQTFVVDVTLHLDLAAAGQSDDLNDTIDYGRVAKDIAAVIEGPHVDLIERLAQRIADKILADAPAVASIDVTVHKPHAPIVESTLRAAVREIDALPGTQVTGISPLYRTAAWGMADGTPDFLNAVVELETTMGSHELLAALQSIEANHGRIRENHWDSRPLDLDIIDFALPHPRAWQRAFVLAPWLALNPNAKLAGAHEGPVADLLAAAPDRNAVQLESEDWMLGGHAVKQKSASESAPVSRKAIISLDSTSQDVERLFRETIVSIDSVPGNQVQGISPLYHVSHFDGPDAMSAVIQIETKLPPADLIAVLGSIESVHDLAVDLDLVDMEGVTSDEPNCSIPWPSARNHASVLAPWLDMDPNASLGGDPVAFLLAMAPDAGQVGLLSDNWILSNS